MSEISLRSPNILEFGSFHITNTVLGGILEMTLLLILGIYVVKRAKLIPGRLQTMMEIVIKMFLDSLEGAYGSRKRAEKYLPYFVTLFIYLVVANQFSVIPLVNQIVTGEGSVLFRVSTADYSQTIALGIMPLLAAHLIALSVSPLKHIGNFIKIMPFFKIRSFTDLANALLELFLGVLDIVGECAKLISISSRLFGNIFAGEVMVAVIAGIAAWTHYILPIPFIVLSIFSGFVQAYVFSILALQFMAGTINSIVPQPKEEITNKQSFNAEAKAI